MNGSNIDDIRSEIMRLENATVFDQKAWAVVLMQLSNSPCRRADAVRRMQTARQNARWIGGVDAAIGVDVSVETEDA